MVRKTSRRRIRRLASKPCKDPTKIRSSKTGYCRKRRRSLPKLSRHRLTRREKLMKQSCPKANQVRNPKTGRCRKSRVSQRGGPRIGTENKTLSACIASKKRLQSMVLRLAHKLSKSGAKKSNTRSHKRKTRRTRKIRKTSHKKRIRRTRKRSRSRASSRELSEEKRYTQQRVAERKATKYDDFLMRILQNNPVKPSKKERVTQVTDTDVRRILSTIEERQPQKGKKESPQRPKKRITPTFIG